MSDSLIRELKHGDELMLSALVALPQAEFCSRRAKKRVENYYKRLGEALIRRCERTLYPAAVSEFIRCREEGLPFVPFSLRLECSVRESTGELVSILLTLHEKTLGEEGFTLLCGDTWRARTGFAIAPFELMDTEYGWKKRLLPQLLEAAEEYSRLGAYDFYAGLGRLMRKNLSRYNIFVENGRTVLFFQPGILAPARQGAVFFPLEFPKDVNSDTGE